MLQLRLAAYSCQFGYFLARGWKAGKCQKKKVTKRGRMNVVRRIQEKGNWKRDIIEINKAERQYKENTMTKMTENRKKAE